MTDVTQPMSPEQLQQMQPMMALAHHADSGEL